MKSRTSFHQCLELDRFAGDAALPLLPSASRGRQHLAGNRVGFIATKFAWAGLRRRWTSTS